MSTAEGQDGIDDGFDAASAGRSDRLLVVLAELTCGHAGC